MFLFVFGKVSAKDAKSAKESKEQICFPGAPQ